MSTSVEHGGEVGNQVQHFSVIWVVSRLANEKKYRVGENSTVMPWAAHVALKAVISGIDPIDLVQPRSKITNVNCLLYLCCSTDPAWRQNSLSKIELTTNEHQSLNGFAV